MTLAEKEECSGVRQTVVAHSRRKNAWRTMCTVEDGVQGWRFVTLSRSKPKGPHTNPQSCFLVSGAVTHRVAFGKGIIDCRPLMDLQLPRMTFVTADEAVGSTPKTYPALPKSVFTPDEMILCPAATVASESSGRLMSQTYSSRPQCLYSRITRRPAHGSPERQWQRFECVHGYVLV